MKAFLRRIDHAFAAAFRYSIILFMILITVIVFGQVIFRYGLDLPLSWSEEVSRFGFVWLVFLGAALLVRTGEHIKVGTFVDPLPVKAKKVIAVLVEGAILGCAAIFLVGGYRIAVNEWGQVSPAVEISMGFVYTVIPASAFMMVAWSVVRLTAALADLREGDGR